MGPHSWREGPLGGPGDGTFPKYSRIAGKRSVCPGAFLVGRKTPEPLVASEPYRIGTTFSFLIAA